MEVEKQIKAAIKDMSPGESLRTLGTLIETVMSVAEESGKGIRQTASIPIGDIDLFPNHPFYVETDDDMNDLAPIMDTILKRLAIKRIEGSVEEEWINGAYHRDMEDALYAMMPKEQEIVRKFFAEGKRILDISIEMNMEVELVGGYIKSARDQIAIWM